jgi:hypothetical protein
MGETKTWKVGDPDRRSPGRGNSTVAQVIASPDRGSGRRAQGKHAFQIIVDTIAYAQNLPLRLLLIDRLKQLPEQISIIIEGEKTKSDIAQILESVPTLSKDDYPKLYDAELLAEVSEWMVSLIKPIPLPPPTGLPDGWLRGMLALLPHIERMVWLTEMGNPLPAHALCRMQSEWALFILFACWEKAKHGAYNTTGKAIIDTFGINGFVGRPLPALTLPEYHDTKQLCVPLVGPIFEIADDHLESSVCHKEFSDYFHTFCKNLRETKWGIASHTAPTELELSDALETRIDFPSPEVVIRSANINRTLSLLLACEIEENAFHEGHLLSRANWETVAVLSAWLARWDRVLASQCKPNEMIKLSLRRRRVGMIAMLIANDGKTPQWKLTIININEYKYSPIQNLDQKLKSIDEKHEHASLQSEHRIDRIEIFFNRIKERQGAFWTRQIISINNLLMRHGSKVTASAQDEMHPVGEKRDSLGGGAEAAEVSHLLNGFGDSICQYIASITRADLADIFWLDYSQAPPRLVHVGGYAGIISHWAKRDEICKNFDQWAWKHGDARDATDKPANMRCASPSQSYRVAAQAVEDPPLLPNGDRSLVAAYEDDKPVPEGMVPSYFDAYPDQPPQDTMGIPMLVNGRVVGVMLLGGVCKRQFDRHLFLPLRRIAVLVAFNMYHQSQLWHMRRLNLLFAKRGSAEFRQHDQNNKFNPLEDVSRCLANIFLCPVAQIWLRSKAFETSYNLHGYNWPGELYDDEKNPEKPTFEYRQVSQRTQSKADPKIDSFAALAIDLWLSEATGVIHSSPKPPFGSFVQGRYIPDESNPDQSEHYDAASAQTKGARLGKDFLPDQLDDTMPAFVHRRARIFQRHEMHDIMSFALIQPSTTDQFWEVVGVVTLHDKGDGMLPRIRKCQSWDQGWNTVVAHMQTYLPYLLTQAEVLNNPVVDAHRYLIHAGRAELLSVLDTANRVRNSLLPALAPNKSVRSNIEKIMLPGFTDDYRKELKNATTILKKAWDAINELNSPDWERNLRVLANIMNNFRELGELNINFAVSNESFLLLSEIKSILDSYEERFRTKNIFWNIDIPAKLNLNLPLLWLRIVLRDLIHNTSKYATPNTDFTIAWDDVNRTLTLRNHAGFRANIDISERLVKYGVRGSASENEDKTDVGYAQAAQRGQGLGLWGAKLLCQTIGIKFEFEIFPIKIFPESIPDSTQAITKAHYLVTLTLPQEVILIRVPSSN